MPARVLVMAMPAATAVAMVVVVLMVTAAASAVVASTAAALTAQMVQHVLNLLVGGIAILKHYASKLQRVACQGVIGIYHHAVFFYGCDAGHEALLVGIHECDNGSRKDVLVVKVPIDGKYVTP